MKNLLQCKEIITQTSATAVVTVRSIGFVESKGDPTSPDLLSEVLDMWNCHIPELAAFHSSGRRSTGTLGMAEVLSPTTIDELTSRLQRPGWHPAPPSLYLAGAMRNGNWAIELLGDFVDLNMRKGFRGENYFYAWMHRIKGVKAFGLTPASDVYNDLGLVHKGVRFPVYGPR